MEGQTYHRAKYYLTIHLAVYHQCENYSFLIYKGLSFAYDASFVVCIPSLSR